ncbi:COG4315 family predicted lipoprotein [Eionea flava]
MKILFATLALLATFTVSAAHHGEALTNKKGMTLYTFDKDQNGQSICYDGCAAKWPPYIASANAKVVAPWGLVERNDGKMQWTYGGQPLYLWVGDQKQGDVTGDGVGGVWHIAKKSHKKAVKKAPVKHSSTGYGGY